MGITLFLWLSFYGCEHQNALSSDIKQQITTTPEQRYSLCETIRSSQQQACYSLLVESLLEKRKKTAVQLLQKTICPQLPSPDKDECFFRLAEQTKNEELCAKAGIFNKDCQLHLLSQALFRSKADSYDRVIEITKQYNTPFDSLEGQTVIYRYLLSLKKPLPIHDCNQYPNRENCRRAAHSLYLDRLRYLRSTSHFPCEDLGDADHSNDPMLQEEYNRFANTECQ